MKQMMHNNKELSILMFMIILLLIIIIILMIFSFKVYASNKDNVEQIASKTENYAEDILVVKKSQEKDQDEQENQRNEISEQNNGEQNQGKEINYEENQEQQVSNKVSEPNKKTAYVTSSGEKYNIIGKLNIPKLNIEYSILSETSTELLKISLNRYWGAYPNQIGNMVVLGHNYKNGKFFSNLLKIHIGDVVKIIDTTGTTLDYSVYKTDIIDPYDNSCTSQLTDGKKEITLITCYYENGNSHATKRFIVKARAD